MQGLMTSLLPTLYSLLIPFLTSRVYIFFTDRSFWERQNRKFHLATQGAYNENETYQTGKRVIECCFADDSTSGTAAGSSGPFRTSGFRELLDTTSEDVFAHTLYDEPDHDFPPISENENVNAAAQQPLVHAVTDEAVQVGEDYACVTDLAGSLRGFATTIDNLPRLQLESRQHAKRIQRLITRLLCASGETATVQRTSEVTEKLCEAFSCNVCYYPAQARVWKCCMAPVICRACEKEQLRQERAKYDFNDEEEVSIRCNNCNAKFRSSEVCILPLSGSALQQAIRLSHNGDQPVRTQLYDLAY